MHADQYGSSGPRHEESDPLLPFESSFHATAPRLISIPDTLQRLNRVFIGRGTEQSQFLTLQHIHTLSLSPCLFSSLSLS